MRRHGLLGLLLIFVSACNGMMNEGSSEPINENEKLQYQQEILRCYKTGGTRVVKIRGVLHCY